MRHIKLYEQFNELDPYGEEEWNDVWNDEDLIEEIKNYVDLSGGCITMYELEADHSPVHAEDEDDGTIYLIERLFNNSVEIVIYGGYKFETELDSYAIPYEHVSNENLKYIKELISDYIQSNL